MANMKLLRQCTRKSPLHKVVFSLFQNNDELRLEFRVTDLPANTDGCIWFWIVTEDLRQTVLDEAVKGDLFNLYCYIGPCGTYIKKD